MQNLGESKIFDPGSEPLTDLLAGIHTHKTALPNFQRPWVWEPQMVRDLLISIAYRYPAGSLLTMPVSGPTFALRPFEGAGEKLKVTPNLMVLDGQQRLTSLYQALYRRDGVTVKGRTFFFFLDIPVLMSEADGAEVGDPLFADSLFYVARDKSNGKLTRYDGLVPRYEITDRDQQLVAGVLPLHYLFGQDEALSNWREDYLAQLSGNDMARFRSLSRHWDRLVAPWLTHIKTYPFPVVQLKADMPLGAICHIFEKVNSTGVPLDVFDLCTAILWAQGLYLNEEWSKQRKAFENNNVLPMQPKPLSGTPFLQGISLLDSIERKRANPAGRVAVACRKEDLMALKADTVRRWWPNLVEGYVEASKFMTDQGILNERILPYTTLILPLSAMFADLIRRRGQAHVGAAWPKIAQWYWCSVFTQRYSSQVESAAALDFEQVIAWADGGDAPDVVRTFAFRSEYLQEISSIRNAMYKGILCLLARNHARDFGNGATLSTSLFYDSRQDHHHIFPVAALRELGISDPRADSIVNKTLISAQVNQSIGGRKPSHYVTSWRAKLAPGASFDDILESHAINSDLLARDDWEAFVLDRRERLRKLVEHACGGSVHPFGDMEEGAVIVLPSGDEEEGVA